MIGGAGADKLYSGTIAKPEQHRRRQHPDRRLDHYDSNATALAAILAQWTAPLPYATQITNLATGNNPSHVALRTGIVLDDNAVDQIFGGGGPRLVLEHRLQRQNHRPQSRHAA